jgi:hypothetical protein
MPRKYKHFNKRRTTYAGEKGAAAGRTFDSFKPERFKNYLTVGELAILVRRDPRWIKRVEADGKIPNPVRFKGVRLYSPEQVKEIQSYFVNVAAGRPKKKRIKEWWVEPDKEGS